jgi:hypothetical protein
LKEFDVNEETANVEIPESIRGEKGVGEHLLFTHDSVERENNNKEVLKYQLETRSWSWDNIEISGDENYGKNVAIDERYYGYRWYVRI